MSQTVHQPQLYIVDEDDTEPRTETDVSVVRGLLNVPEVFGAPINVWTRTPTPDTDSDLGSFLPDFRHEPPVDKFTL